MLGRLALPTYFSIECPGGSEVNSLMLEGKSGGQKLCDAKNKTEVRYNSQP